VVRTARHLGLGNSRLVRIGDETPCRARPVAMAAEGADIVICGFDLEVS
jgi:hypothetical protein